MVRATTFVYFSCLVTGVFGRHTHRAYRHKHLHRQVATASSSSAISLPSLEVTLFTDTDAVDQALNDSPQDVLDLLTALSKNLDEDEVLLASIIASLGTTSSAASSQTSMTSTILAPSSSALSDTSQTTTSTITRTTTLTRSVYTTVTMSSGSTSAPTPTADASDSDNATTTTSEVIYSVAPAASNQYIFNASSGSNVAVYYGQTPVTTAGGLLELCENANVDMVILAFVTTFYGPGGYPSADFGPGCSSHTAAQQQNASGLPECVTLATEITGCQQLGKPVLVSLGGYYANVTFSSSIQAAEAATTLWELFGAGDGLDPSHRPFGSVVIDGFDMDNESGDPAYYDIFAQVLRGLFSRDTSKTYYLSAAPQCPRPDASIPLAAMAYADFVFVQFYNNPSWDLDSAGFQDSFAGWSADLAAVSNTTRVYIGAGAFAGAGSGYVVGSGLETRVSLVRELDLANLGGIMLWDGSEALGNVDASGDDYLVYAKDSLE